MQQAFNFLIIEYKNEKWNIVRGLGIAPSYIVGTSSQKKDPESHHISNKI